MIVVRLLAGVSLLTLGRKLYWLFVGAVGFVAAFFVVEQFFPLQPEWATLLVALLAGILGVFLAIFLQHTAIFLGGFLAGGYLVANLTAMMNWHAGRYNWVLLLIGGMVCAVLAMIMFDWALIALSSLAGAMVIVRAFTLPPMIALALTVGLFLLGAAIQVAIKHRERPEPKDKKEAQTGRAIKA